MNVWISNGKGRQRNIPLGFFLELNIQEGKIPLPSRSVKVSTSNFAQCLAHKVIGATSGPQLCAWTILTAVCLASVPQRAHSWCWGSFLGLGLIPHSLGWDSFLIPGVGALSWCSAENSLTLLLVKPMQKVSFFCLILFCATVTTVVKHPLHKSSRKSSVELERSWDAWICFRIFSFLYFAGFTSSCSWAEEDRFRLFKAAFLKINQLKHSPWGSCSCWDFKEEFESLAPPSGSKSFVLTQWETRWWGRILWQGQAGSVPKHTLLFLKESCLMKQMT